MIVPPHIKKCQQNLRAVKHYKLVAPLYELICRKTPIYIWTYTDLYWYRS